MSEIEIRMWAIEKAHEFYGNDLGRLLLVAEALFRMVWSGKPVMIDRESHDVNFDLLLKDMAPSRRVRSMSEKTRIAALNAAVSLTQVGEYDPNGTLELADILDEWLRLDHGQHSSGDIDIKAGLVSPEQIRERDLTPNPHINTDPNELLQWAIQTVGLGRFGAEDTGVILQDASALLAWYRATALQFQSPGGEEDCLSFSDSYSDLSSEEGTSFHSEEPFDSSSVVADGESGDSAATGSRDERTPDGEGA